MVDHHWSLNNFWNTELSERFFLDSILLTQTMYMFSWLWQLLAYFLTTALILVTASRNWLWTEVGGRGRQFGGSFLPFLNVLFFFQCWVFNLNKCSITELQLQPFVYVCSLSFCIAGSWMQSLLYSRVGLYHSAITISLFKMMYLWNCLIVMSSLWHFGVVDMLFFLNSPSRCRLVWKSFWKHNSIQK